MDCCCIFAYTRHCLRKRCNNVKIERQQHAKNPQKRVLPFWLEIDNAVDHTTPPAPAYIEQRPAPIHTTIHCWPPSSPGKRKRRRTCLDEVEGVHHKKKKSNLGKIIRRCMECGQPLCTLHFEMICPSCFNQNFPLYDVSSKIDYFLIVKGSFIAIFICYFSWSWPL